MVYRAALPADTEAIGAFLVAHSDTSMFLRANLAEHGPCGGAARNATRMWIREEAGAVSGVFGITTAGFVLVQLPDAAPAADIAEILAPFAINGIIGATPQVRRMQGWLGLAGAGVQLDEDEPLYSLDLSELAPPQGENTLRPAVEGDLPLLERWRAAYLVETIHFSDGEARELAAGDVAAMQARGSLMLLEDGAGAALAMTSFNAILPDMVQIGNVYVPPERRGRGHAREVVARHLARARGAGVRRAILFASGPAASRAYEAIGFRQVGHFTLLFFAERQSVRSAP
ncbi:MAG: GNAT family N-acetyltransferase [Tropicimonas sp.]|uniref:GNAT family N-acetyltransferase n=1 Tax=Tropicimonas sp. TaxID=2067044 RepID=UPI003A887CA0